MDRLPVPYLPQSINNDGLICHTDVELLPGVIIRIYKYDLAATGDLIRLYWNDSLAGEFLVSGTIPPFWDTIIPISEVSSNFNTVYYTVQDALQNINYSETITVFILQNCNATLPPPSFTDAVNGIINENNIITQQGTHITVRPYESFIQGDDVTVFFDGYTNDGVLIPAAHYQESHTLSTTDILNGFSVRVPAAYLFAIGNGQAQTKYTRQSAGSADIEYSDTAIATVVATSALLPAPIYDDAEHGWLDAAAVSGGIAVSVRVALTLDIEPGDTVTLNWSGYNFYGQLITGTSGSNVHAPVSAADIAAGVLHFIIPDTLVTFADIMWLRCEYTVVNIATNKFRYSENATALLDVRGRSVPAPTFPYVVSGMLTQESIVTNNGTLLRTSYPGMAVGDTLYFTINGVDATGNAIAAASYSTSVIVNVTQSSTNIVDITIPAANLLAVGDNGVITARYSVLFAYAPGGFAISSNSEVRMSLNTAINDLKFIISQGAAVTDFNTINVYPFNRGLISGLPGSSVRVEVPNSVYINESSAHEYNTILNQYGLAEFKIYSSQSGNVAISVYGATENSSNNTYFGSYTKVDNNLIAINSTTNAPISTSRARIPNSIYLKTANLSTLTKVRVEILNSQTATILGYSGNVAEVLLNSDKSASIDIIDYAEELLDVMITLPEASGTIKYLTLSYVNFLTLNQHQNGHDNLYGH